MAKLAGVVDSLLGVLTGAVQRRHRSVHHGSDLVAQRVIQIFPAGRVGLLKAGTGLI